MKIPANRSSVSGFDTNVNTACQQNISIGMSQVGLISTSASSLTTHQRMIFASGEFSNINTKNSKMVDQLVERYWWLCPMGELIMDHSAEFGAHRVHDDGDGIAISSSTSNAMASNPSWQR